MRGEGGRGRKGEGRGGGGGEEEKKREDKINMVTCISLTEASMHASEMEVFSYSNYLNNY